MRALADRRPPGGDLILGAALAALGLCELFIRGLNADFPGPRAVNAAAVVLVAAPVVFRRRAPLRALVLYWLPAQVWIDAAYGPHSSLPIEPFLALLILVYTAAAWTDARGQRVVAVLLAVLFASELALLVAGRKGLGNVVPGLVFISLAYALGRGLRARRAHTDLLVERAAELEELGEALARRAVVEERDRIARELHDVIAHSVSVMIVQAGAAERLLDRPDEAGVALEAIRRAGSEALDELRRLLGLLRESAQDGNQFEPQPGIARLDDLIEQTRAAGLPVHYALEGTRRALAPGLDLAVYRIVQEALTNVRKHAGPASAELRIVFSTNALEVIVRDDGPGNGRPRSAGSRHGLVGMRERVALYGGTLTSGARPGGGFQVQVLIPLRGGAT